MSTRESEVSVGVRVTWCDSNVCSEEEWCFYIDHRCHACLKRILFEISRAGGNRSRKRKSIGKEEDVENALLLCRPRCASFRASLEAKSLRPARTLGTHYTPVYLTLAAEI